MVPQHFRVHHDGHYYYHFGIMGDSEAKYFADGEQMSEVVRNYGWYVADHKPEVIERQPRTQHEVVNYTLDGRVSPSESMAAVIDEDTYDHLPETLQALYQVHLRQIVPPRERVDYNWIDLDGTPPPPDDGITWTSELPFALRNYPQYHHLFPGRLQDFRAHLKVALTAIPGIEAYDLDKFTCYVKVQLEVPRPYKNGRRTATITTTSVAVEFSEFIPYSIEGENRAAAKAKWDALMSQFIEEAKAYLGGQLCSHCNGSGRVFGPRKKVGL